MMKRSLALVTAALTILAAPAWAVPTIDGTADAEYGTALSVQNTDTQFGDNDLGDLIATRNGGSEIDQVFATVSGGRLYVTVAGNLERNFNKLEVFFDTKTGGVNTLVGATLPDQVDGFCCGNTPGAGALQEMDGLTFDTGFNADYYLTFTHGLEGDLDNDFWAMSAHFADLSKGPGDPTARVAAGMQLGPQGRPVVLRFPFDSDFNNNSSADGGDFLTWQQNFGTTTGATRATGDANADAAVDSADLAVWTNDLGVTRSLTDISFVPNPGTPPTTALIGPTLPDLNQGDLIDKNYVAAHGGATPIAAELAFADADHRDMDNSILGLKMALNNSNVVGVIGGGGATAQDPTVVRTGIEFSIPLSQIGNPTSVTDIVMSVFVNGGIHDFVSNQFGGDGILGGNPGPPAAVNFNTLPGNQFVTVPVPAVAAAAGVPEPGAAALGAMALMGLAAATRRRR